MQPMRTAGAMIASAAAFAASVVSTSLLTGCAGPQHQPNASATHNTATVASDRQATVTVQSLRDAFLQRNPNAKFGEVTAVLPQNQLAAVGDLPVDQFRRGDTICVLDNVTFNSSRRDFACSNCARVRSTCASAA